MIKDVILCNVSCNRFDVKQSLRTILKYRVFINKNIETSCKRDVVLCNIYEMRRSVTVIEK